MSDNNPFEATAAGLGVTIKYGKGYEESWLTVRGTSDQIRAQIIEFFGLDAEAVKGLTGNEILCTATNVAHGAMAAINRVGALPISSTVTVETTAPAAAQESEPDGWDDDVRGAAAEDGISPLFAEIEATASVIDLKKWWAGNQAAYAADAEVQEAYKTKMRALKAAVAA